MSSGAKVLSAFIRETTPGITPAGAWNLLKRSSWGVKPSQSTNDNDEIGGTRDVAGERALIEHAHRSDQGSDGSRGEARTDDLDLRKLRHAR